MLMVMLVLVLVLALMLIVHPCALLCTAVVLRAR